MVLWPHSRRRRKMTTKRIPINICRISLWCLLHKKKWSWPDHYLQCQSGMLNQAQSASNKCKRRGKVGSTVCVITSEFGTSNEIPLCQDPGGRVVSTALLGTRRSVAGSPRIPQGYNWARGARRMTHAEGGGVLQHGNQVHRDDTVPELTRPQ